MFGFGKKVGMTRVLVEDRYLPVTAIKFENQYKVFQKTKDNDGYQAVQIGSGQKRKGKKPIVGHTKKHIKKYIHPKILGEFKVPENLIKDEYKIDDFSESDLLDLTGVSFGKGFTGVVKRYNFGGQPKSHGHEGVKARGSIGSMYPQRVLPGTKMAGNEGNKTITLKKVKIVAIDKEQQLLFVKGSVPGSNGGYLKLSKVN